MAGKPCCCLRPCAICAPAIDSPARDDISDIFIERSGDWEVVLEPLGDYVLQENGTAGAVAQCLTCNPVSTPTGQATGRIFSVQDGRKYRVIINYNPATSAYLYAELETLGSGTATLRVVSTDSGTLDSTAVGYSVDENVDLSICRTLTGVYAILEPVDVVVWACIDGWNGGRCAGLGNGNTSVIQWLEFEFREHTYTQQPVNCAFCHCECGGDPPDQIGICLPKQFLLTIEASGDCECLDGITSVMNLTSRDPRTWYTEFEACGSVTYAFELTCTAAPEYFSLCDLSDTPCDSWEDDCSPGLGGGADSVGCDPIIITFAPEGCHPASVEDPDCHVSITITEYVP